MNELKVFEGNTIGLIFDGDNVLFEVYSTGMALGQAKSNSHGVSYPRKDRIDANIKSAEIVPCVRNGHKYISEEQLYDLMLEMKTDKVKPFRKWVTSEVLPSIRKNGGYIANQDNLTPEQIVANALVVAQNIIEQQKAQLQEQKPMVEFAESVSQSVNSISIGDFAKLVADENIKIGRNRLFDWLRENKFIDRNNVPYQRYIENNTFEVVEQTYKTPYGEKTSTKTLVTGKGQIYLIEKLRNLF